MSVAYNISKLVLKSIFGYFQEWGTTCLSFEEDPEPFGRVRDQNIMAMCRGMNITVISLVAHTLYKLEW